MFATQYNLTIACGGCSIKFRRQYEILILVHCVSNLLVTAIRHCPFGAFARGVLCSKDESSSVTFIEEDSIGITFVNLFQNSCSISRIRK